MPLGIQFGNFVYSTNDCYVEPDGWEDNIITAGGPQETLHADRGYPSTARLQGREISVKGIITSPSWTSRDDLKSAVDAFLWAHRPGRVAALYLYTDRYINAQVLDSPTIIDTGLMYVRFSVRFKAADPYWYYTIPGSNNIGLHAFYNFTDNGTGEDLTHSSWTKTGVTIGSDITTTPSLQIINTNRIKEDTSTGLHKVEHDQSMSQGGAYWVVAFAKPAERTWARLNIVDCAGTEKYAWFNLSTPAVGTTSGIITTIVQSVGGWILCGVMVNAGTGSLTPKIGLQLGRNDNDNGAYAGTSGYGLWAWGFLCSAACVQDSVLNVGNNACLNINWVWDEFSYPPTNKHVIICNVTTGEYMGLYFAPPSAVAVAVNSQDNMITVAGQKTFTPWKSGDFVHLANGYNTVATYVSNARWAGWTMTWSPRWL